MTDQIDINAIADILKANQENNKIPDQQESYFLFSEGDKAEIEFKRKPPHYKTRKLLDELRCKVSELVHSRSEKETICKRYGWGAYTEEIKKPVVKKDENGEDVQGYKTEEVTKYGKDVISEELTEIEFFEKAVELVVLNHKDLEGYNRDDWNTYEMQRMVRDFLVSGNLR